MSLAALAAFISTAHADTAMMVGKNGFSTTPLFTVGEEVNGYFPPGVFDGLAAYDWGGEVCLLVNHELETDTGYPFTLANGTILTGARISRLVIDKASRSVKEAGLAFDTIYNRLGKSVADPSDLVFGGLDRFCSSSGVDAGTYGFVDAIYFAGEETPGGTQWALDVKEGDLWGAPALGVGAWEKASPLAVPSINETHVALLMGDDQAGAPLYLYVGEKDKRAGAGFLARNGLAAGKLYMWKADDGATRPSEFAGRGHSKTGRFIEIENFNPAMAGQPGFDDQGYATQDYLDAQRDALGAFRFSRPEDVNTNPYNGTQAVFASTGGVPDLLATDPAFDEADIWGTTYLVDVKISLDRLRQGDLGANLRVIYDGDDDVSVSNPRPSFGLHPGLRSPDNVCWARDHNVNVQEDRATGYYVPDDIGNLSGEEASIWQIQPHSGARLRVAEMNRSAELPDGQEEGDFAGIPLNLVLGIWESSGIIEVSSLFGEEKGSLFLFDVQAHATRGGAIDAENLVEGGQILFLQKH
jgi:glycerophosphoryl diester phosphodiesterase